MLNNAKSALNSAFNNAVTQKFKLRFACEIVISSSSPLGENRGDGRGHKGRVRDGGKGWKEERTADIKWKKASIDNFGHLLIRPPVVNLLQFQFLFRFFTCLYLIRWKNRFENWEVYFLRKFQRYVGCWLFKFLLGVMMLGN